MSNTESALVAAVAALGAFADVAAAGAVAAAAAYGRRKSHCRLTAKRPLPLLLRQPSGSVYSKSRSQKSNSRETVEVGTGAER